MKHKLGCLSTVLIFIALIPFSARGQSLRQIHSYELGVNELGTNLIADSAKGVLRTDIPGNAPRSESKPLLIPDGISLGMLIHKVDPEYPGAAKAANISGIVTLKATISKKGEIQDLQVVCGPEKLLEPSLKAIREWKYRPYLLRGEPIEVQTTIKVTFALGGKKKRPFSKDSCPAE